MPSQKGKQKVNRISLHTHPRKLELLQAALAAANAGITDPTYQYNLYQKGKRDISVVLPARYDKMSMEQAARLRTAFTQHLDPSIDKSTVVWMGDGKYQAILKEERRQQKERDAIASLETASFLGLYQSLSRTEVNDEDQNTLTPSAPSQPPAPPTITNTVNQMVQQSDPQMMDASSPDAQASQSFTTFTSKSRHHQSDTQVTESPSPDSRASQSATTLTSKRSRNQPRKDTKTASPSSSDPSILNPDTYPAPHTSSPKAFDVSEFKEKTRHNAPWQEVRFDAPPLAASTPILPTATAADAAEPTSVAGGPLAQLHPALLKMLPQDIKMFAMKHPNHVVVYGAFVYVGWELEERTEVAKRVLMVKFLAEISRIRAEVDGLHDSLGRSKMRVEELRHELEDGIEGKADLVDEKKRKELEIASVEKSLRRLERHMSSLQKISTRSGIDKQLDFYVDRMNMENVLHFAQLSTEEHEVPLIKRMIEKLNCRPFSDAMEILQTTTDEDLDAVKSAQMEFQVLKEQGTPSDRDSATHKTANDAMDEDEDMDGDAFENYENDVTVLRKRYTKFAPYATIGVHGDTVGFPAVLENVDLKIDSRIFHVGRASELVQSGVRRKLVVGDLVWAPCAFQVIQDMTPMPTGEDVMEVLELDRIRVDMDKRRLAIPNDLNSEIHIRISRIFWFAGVIEEGYEEESWNNVFEIQKILRSHASLEDYLDWVETVRRKVFTVRVFGFDTVWQFEAGSLRHFDDWPENNYVPNAKKIYEPYQNSVKEATKKAVKRMGNKPSAKRLLGVPGKTDQKDGRAKRGRTITNAPRSDNEFHPAPAELLGVPKAPSFSATIPSSAPLNSNHQSMLVLPLEHSGYPMSYGHLPYQLTPDSKNQPQQFGIHPLPQTTPTSQPAPQPYTSQQPPSKRRQSRPNIVIPHWQGPPEPSPLNQSRPTPHTSLSATHRSAHDISMGLRSAAPYNSMQSSRPDLMGGGGGGGGMPGQMMRHQSMPQLYDSQHQGWQGGQQQMGNGFPPYPPQQMHQQRNSYQLGIDNGEGLEGASVGGSFQNLPNLQNLQNIDKQSIYNVATKVLDGLESVGSKLAEAVGAAATKYGLMTDDAARYQNRVSEERRRQSVTSIPSYSTIQPVQSGLYQPPVQRSSSYRSFDPTSLV
ncbi:hypothetical protein HK097_005174 [Rhizophlyctis rosea]|uniref:Uncharacterized protein n=1 Tax=Rhizophlyctis rosea TaxID=64517 RepID=A0AAD5SF39_9FUNG|nr:hypothetical protein HK097_005174 [Rhizophlyctis rosea]